jgi:multiple sugar transport system substrate-binding protein
MSLKEGFMAWLAVAIGLGTAVATTVGSAEAAGQFDGVTVNIATFTGPPIAEPLQRRAPDFEKLTGAKINVVTVPFSDLYEKILTNFATGTNSYDAIVFDPQWVVDFIEPGYVEQLDARIAADKALDWEGIMPFFRDFSSTYKGHVYSIPLDGDFQMVYYRIDLLKKYGLKPPVTWDDYIAVAKALNGKDFMGDGKTGYGSCIPKKRSAQSYWMITSVAAPFIQTQGTSEGVFFDRDTFKPLINNDGFKRALEIYKETTKYGPPDEINLEIGDTRGLVTSGRCALALDWGDIGPLAVDRTTSRVMDLIGAVITPGTKEVVDRATGKLVPCDAKRCPYAIDGVNHAPFAAYGGWTGGVNAAAPAKVKDAAYAFISYMSQSAQSDIDVTIGITGFNPYRKSHFENLKPWLDSGMTKAAADNYLDAIKASLESPNMVLDLRVPQNQRYQQIVLDTAMHRLLAGELTVDQTAVEVEKGWNEITDELGKADQLAAYRNSLGVKR